MGVSVRHGGRLGTRLATAFALVSLVTVTLLILAAQAAVDTGLRAVRADGLSAVATRLAQVAASAYTASGGWPGADLTAVREQADRAGTAITVTTASGEVVLDSTQSRGQGQGMGQGMGTTRPVVVDGAEVGSVAVRSDGPVTAMDAEARGRELAWSWIIGAGVVSLVLALVAGWLVTRWLTRPVRELADVARSFAAGDRGRRASPGGASELADLAVGFNEAADAVQRSADARRQMAADVAHELRTPLAAMQAGLEELRDGLVPADHETLDRLHAQAIRLGRVVGDLSLLAAVEDAPAAIAPGHTDLAALTRAELDARGPELRAAGVVVRAVALDAVPVRADADRVHQVIGNILANCARHCRPGDHVDVAVRIEQGQGVLEVRDDGPGIAAADLPFVQDRYWRSADSPGSGLGLAVAREIVEGHRGRLEVTSTPGAGTTVVVRLPLG